MTRLDGVRPTTYIHTYIYFISDDFILFTFYSSLVMTAASPILYRFHDTANYWPKNVSQTAYSIQDPFPLEVLTICSVEN